MHSAYGPATPQKWWRDPASANEAQSAANNLAIPVRLIGLKCESPQLIAHVSEQRLRDAVIEIDGPDVDAIMQVGTNLAFARVAAIAEFWLDKPVIAINTATYWWALRQAGINDKVHGFGRPMVEH